MESERGSCYVWLISVEIRLYKARTIWSSPFFCCIYTKSVDSFDHFLYVWFIAVKQLIESLVAKIFRKRGRVGLLRRLWTPMNVSSVSSNLTASSNSRLVIQQLENGFLHSCTRLNIRFMEGTLTSESRREFYFDVCGEIGKSMGLCMIPRIKFHPTFKSRYTSIHFN